MSQLDPKRRVVVTGLGVVSSIGIGWQEFWKNLLAGKSGINKVQSIDTTLYENHRAGEIQNFVVNGFVGRHKVSKLGRASLFAIAASKLAIQDAKLSIEEFQNSIGGLCVGTTMGESQLIEFMGKTMVDSDESDIGSLEALSYPANSIATNVADEFKIKGQNLLFANACAAGNYAICYAFDLIRSGKTKMIFAGGSDALSRIAFTGFGRLYAMSPDICQPFDINRKGMMLGEGAGMLLLEEYQSAFDRRADIYAEIVGYGMSCDAHHMTHPDPRGVVKALQKSLTSAGLEPADVNYISAHGTGTPENDKAECEAINRVFGESAARIPVSSIKSMLGHTMGAASALESIVCCLAVKYGEVPPTINLQERDPFCNIDCVPNKGRKHSVNVALNNSQAFGGNNASTCFIREN